MSKGKPFKLEPPPAPRVGIRVRWMRDQDVAMPLTARLLVDHFRHNKLPEIYCSLALLPVTVNNQHIPNTFVLKDEVHDFRKLVAFALGAQKLEWKPVGVTAAILVFESPSWLTLEHTIRKADADNRIKPTIDAVALATETDDKNAWEVHAYKLVSNRVRTRIWLFDMGDLVDGCSLKE